MIAPTEPGFYWAKWMIADDHLPDDYTPFKTWEPVEVYLNDDNQLRVWMMGHDFNQGTDCFHWGDRLAAPLDRIAALNKQAEEQKLIDARIRYQRMTPDERETFLFQRRNQRQ